MTDGNTNNVTQEEIVEEVDTDLLPEIEGSIQDSNIKIDDITGKDKDRRERHYFSGISLILYCLLFLLFIFVVDSVTTILCGVSSKTTNSIIEIIKALLFSLSGYLFARNENL